MGATITHLAGMHQALWALDGWYKRAWFVWPQALSLFGVVLLLTYEDAAPPAPVAAQWVKPVATAAPDGEDSKLCNNVMADAKQRGEACDRLIKSGKIAGLALADAYFGRGWMNQLLNQYDAAIADYSEVLKINPRSYPALNNRGWMYVNKNDLDKALQDLSQSIEINRTALNAVALANRAEVLRRQSKLTEALTDVTEALKLNDRMEWAVTVRNNVRADFKRLEEQARKPAPSPAPSQADPAAERRTRAHALLQKNDYEGVIAELSVLIREGSRVPWDFDTRAMAYVRKKPSDLNSAMADTTQAISLAGHDWRPHARRAEIFISRGQYKEALDDLNAAINDHAPVEAIAFILRGRVHLHNGAHDLAWRDFNKAIELAPNDAEAYLLRGQALASAVHKVVEACRNDGGGQRQLVGASPCSRPVDFNQAEADFKTAFAKNPKLAQAPYEIGRIMYALDRYDDAVKAFTEAIRVSPNFALAYNNRGVAYVKLKQRELAFADFTEAVRHDQRVIAAWTNRADMFALAGRRQEAIGDYRKALDIDGNYAPAREGLRRLGVSP